MRPVRETECLRFADWMGRALHDPVTGYYARQVKTVGRQGDFSTSATTGDVLGEAITQWLGQEMSQHAGIRTVIEVGGGDGSLSAAVRRSLGWWKRCRLRWCMVESSAPLRARQQAALGWGTVHWYNDVAAALDACGGRALIFHNELLDAFPVSLLQWDAAGERWQELWIRSEAGHWREDLLPAELTSEQQRMHGALAPEAWGTVPLREGQRLELGTAGLDWLAGWAPHWKAGAMLTLDYGDRFPQLYHRQSRGTVRAYFMHQRLTGGQVYENMGRQDITADVNFTDVIAVGDALGWTAQPLVTQREFLFQHVRGLEATAGLDPAAAFLVDEHGAGTAFKALVQRPA